MEQDNRSTKPRFYLLRLKEVAEVSIVGRPANARPFLLLKGNKMDNVETFVADLMALEIEDKDRFAEITKNMSDDAREAVGVAFRSLQAVREEIEPAHMEEIAAAFGWQPKPVEIPAVAEPAAAAEVDTAPELPEEVTKAIADKDAELEAVRKRLAEVEEAETVRKYAGQAAEYVVPGMSADEIAAVLRAADGVNEEHAATVRKGFAATTKLVQNSDALNETGTAGTGEETDPADKLDRIAKSIQSEDSSLTYHQAYARALKANPELYQG